MISGERILSTSEAAYAVDRNGQIVVWNRASEQTFGYSKSQALGRSCWELLSGRDIFGNRCCCEGCPVRASAFNDQLVNRFKIDFKTAAQERKKFDVTALMLINETGENLFVHICIPETHAAEPVRSLTATGKHLYKLTPREIEVLTLLHRGMTVEDIAAALSICSSTVRNHTQHILYKLNVHSRFEAVALGRQIGLI
jgi:DNA-binding CsgD family transcriptional regulator